MSHTRLNNSNVSIWLILKKFWIDNFAVGTSNAKTPAYLRGIPLQQWLNQPQDSPRDISCKIMTNTESPVLQIIIIIIIIYPLTTKVVGAPQMILQPVFSIFPCSPLPSGTCRTPGLSVPWGCLPTSSFVCLVFFPLSLCLARWFWPDLMNGKHDHTTAVWIFLRSSGDLHVVQLPAVSFNGLPRW